MVPISICELIYIPFAAVPTFNKIEVKETGDILHTHTFPVVIWNVGSDLVEFGKPSCSIDKKKIFDCSAFVGPAKSFFYQNTTWTYHELNVTDEAIEDTSRLVLKIPVWKSKRSAHTSNCDY